MGRFTAGPVRITVPATSANLGPGYDCLGLALSLRDELWAEVTESGLAVAVTGEAADQVPRDETHLVVRSMRAAFEAMGVAPAGLRVGCRNAIPHSRGLGSSAAATVGGIALARGLVTEAAAALDARGAFELAAAIEGHPDNVAPAAFGGLVVSGREGGSFFAVPCPVDVSLRAVAFAPPYAVPTSLARALLPAVVPHEDAAANAGRAALLVSALAGAPQHLLLATRDFLHQDYREAALGESVALVRSLRDRGVPAVVSGAGPAVLAFTDAAGEGALAAAAPHGWRAHRLGVETTGVRVEP